LGGRERFAWVLVARRSNVIEGENRPPVLDAHPLHDPRVGGVDVERLQEDVGNDALRMKMPGPVHVEREAGVVQGVHDTLPIGSREGRSLRKGPSRRRRSSSVMRRMVRAFLISMAITIARYP